MKSVGAMNSDQVLGRGGPAAFTVSVSGVTMWAAMNAVGAFIGHFFTENQALAAAEFANAHLTIERDGEIDDAHIIKATYTIAYLDNRTTTIIKYAAIRWKDGYMLSLFLKNKDDVIVALGESLEIDDDNHVTSPRFKP
ncbi:hypothetical protein [Chelativorans sp. AA-79]|uniref:hypothetical protein n=1 Tax=Chelativorans sp. AA-79 TaxID=3028735 RepID=UPI0023F995BD|nr:hypothetical protein [Chelativorans sp. AA-79]WEX11675.1 hypothetical protein PVE73_12485 [Chelativorans sp. AA-79]